MIIVFIKSSLIGATEENQSILSHYVRSFVRVSKTFGSATFGVPAVATQ
jgi:hypothetical protein